MISKATHKEIHRQLPDYVLGLLAPRRAEEVADHLAGCAACRDAVLAEREIGRVVRSTLNTSTRPDAVRLRHLMPPVPPDATLVTIMILFTNDGQADATNIVLVDSAVIPTVGSNPPHLMQMQPEVGFSGTIAAGESDTVGFAKSPGDVRGGLELAVARVI